jgi:uncharacterized protein (TIGR02145 family)
MKRLILLIISTVLFYGILTAQTPQAFKYQAVARNINGNLIQNQQVAFRIDILQGGPSGNLVYRERHTTSTNDYGLANLQIGNGTVLIGNFTAIDWSAGQMFMNILFDPNDGYSFINMGTIELLSVPYALYADSSGSSFWKRTGNNLNYDTGSVSIGTDQPSSSAILELNSTDKGLLLPRMTSVQIANIQDPKGGLMVYSITDHNVYIFNDSLFIWTPLIMSTFFISPFCGIPIVDFRDYQIYQTKKIGTQCWFKENLNYGTRIDAPSLQTDNGIPEKYCWNNDPDNCTEYGGLYEWGEMMNYSATSGARGLCPYGWHVPSENDWCILLTYLDPTVSCTGSGWKGTDAGGKLKEESTTHWTTPNTGATNESGFTALPGNGYSDGWFLPLGTYGNFWSSESYWLWKLKNDDARIYHANEGFPVSRWSVRCIRDY